MQKGQAMSVIQEHDLVRICIQAAGTRQDAKLTAFIQVGGMISIFLIILYINIKVSIIWS